jgi:hypothetical protein
MGKTSLGVCSWPILELDVTRSSFVDPYKENNHGPCLLIQREKDLFDVVG